MNLTRITFENLVLNFEDNNYNNHLSFTYNSQVYNLIVVYVNNTIYLYLANNFAQKVSLPNYLYKGVDFDFCFVAPSYEDSKDFGINTIFTKYELGIISYD